MQSTFITDLVSTAWSLKAASWNRPAISQERMVIILVLLPFAFPFSKGVIVNDAGLDYRLNG